MTDSRQITETAVEVLLRRGVDSIIEKAIQFVDKNNLKDLSPSQMNRLQNIYLKYSKDSTKQKDEVRKFINDQKNKEGKKKAKKWSTLGDSLYERIFMFDSSEKDEVKEEFEKLCEGSLSLELIFDPENKDWINNKLEPLLSNMMFNAIFTYYRCRKECLSIAQFEE